MIEQYLQVALEFVKEIWFQLNSQFGLEETEAFKFIQTYLLQLHDNPTYIGIAFASLVLVPYGLYKVRSISRKREQKLEELMEEMEEDEMDEKDPARLRRSNPEVEEENSFPHIQILEKLDEKEIEDVLHVDTKKVMGTDKNIEPISSELAEPQIDESLSEFEEFELTNDLIKNYPELNNAEQDDVIQELQDEMESTINKLTDKLESTPEASSSIKDLGDIRIDDEAAIDEELSLEEPPELNDLEPEPLSLETLNLTDEVEPAIENIEPIIEGIKPEAPPLQPVPERDYSIEDRPDRQADSLINRLKYFQENLDTRFHHRETRDPGPEPKIDELVSDPRFVEQRDFVPKAPKVSPVDNKKYMEVLESFIFLKDQNKH